MCLAISIEADQHRRTLPLIDFWLRRDRLVPSPEIKVNIKMFLKIWAPIDAQCSCDAFCTEQR